MDVKYIPADWEKMRAGLSDLVGRGLGSGVFDHLKDINELLEDAERDIARYDVDGAISFHHKSQKSLYNSLSDDFSVLHRFTGKVGDIVDRTIDEPFYKDMDAFVQSVRDLSISNYTTGNRIGAKETVQYGYGAGTTQMEVPKTEVGIDDLLSGGNFYADQMKQQFEDWKIANPDQEISEDKYRMAAVNSRAFEYESIRDKQENKEFWAGIAALVVIVGVSLVCPPAGIALGAAYGVMEVSSAVSGKDWVSERELSTSERWTRGLLAPLDIIPAAGAVSKFAKGAKLAQLSGHMGELGVRNGIKAIPSAPAAIRNLTEQAAQHTATRLRSAQAAIHSAGSALKNKVVKDFKEVGELFKYVASSLNISSSRQRLAFARMGDEAVLSGGRWVDDTAPNNSSNVSDNLTNKTNKIPEISEVNYGDHFLKGKRGRKELSPNVRYVTRDGYKYTTDDLGRIVDVEADNLILKEAERNLGMQRAAGREDRLPDDDGGHLIGSQFHGSGDIDNLVAQNSQINRSGGEWYKMETIWAKALKEVPPKKVSVKIEPVYNGNSLRPSYFEVLYKVEGKRLVKKIIKNQPGG